MGESDDDDNFVVIGSALEPLEDDAVARKKPVNIQDQVVVDENGRRRFHGAFTGGFSAGYYNTVGSKEGWAPSTFKSSRSGRSSVKSQNVHDFMDDEDVGSFGIAPQILRPTEDFTSKSRDRENLKRSRPTPSDGPIPGTPILHQIIKPVIETVGVKVLRKMGWRPGQGVGPKALRSRTKQTESQEPKPKEKKQIVQEVQEKTSDSSKFYGCSLPPQQMATRSDEGSGSSSDDENIRPLLFAPKDTDSPLCTPKENTFGLGYKGLDRNTLQSSHVDLFGPSLKFQVDNKKMNIAGEAFGIGVFEDADHEVYSRDDMTQYDFALETTQERKHRLLKEAREKDKKKKKKDQVGVISGFNRAKKSALSQKYFPPPPLPQDYEPIHGQKKSRFDVPTVEGDKNVQSKKLGLDRHQLSRDERQVLLESDTIPRKIIEKTTEKNETIQTSMPPPTSLLNLKPEKTNEKDSIERIERLKKFAEVLNAYSSKSKSDTNFKPFLKNPAKQERYEKYITLRAAGYGECLKDLQPPEMTEWEREREKMEFERASALYKPMSGEMSSRFVSAKSHDISHIVPEREKEQEKDPSQDPKIAAKMNLFGKLTHKVMEWHPDRIVCKRFNVPPPYPNSKMVGVVSSGTCEIKTEMKEPEVKESMTKKSLFDDLDFSKPPPGLFPVAPELVSSTASTSAISQVDVQPTSLSDNTQLPHIDVPIESSKPPLDLFKEIFADTSESEQEDELQKSVPSTMNKGSSGDKSQGKGMETVIKRSDTLTILNKEPPSEQKEKSRTGEDLSRHQESPGIFHNLDFSKLTPSSSASLTTSSISCEQKQERGRFGHSFRLSSTVNHESSTASTSELDCEAINDDSIYGPAPPPFNLQKKSLKSTLEAGSSQTKRNYNYTSISNRVERKSTQSASSEDEIMWVEKDAVGSSSKSKKKHSKKLHKSHHHHHSKSKKTKKHKSSDKHKSKKHKSKSGHRDKSETDTSDSDSNSDQAKFPHVSIHNSQNSRALISKLKEMI